MEILKVFKRRILNTLKFVRKGFWRIFGVAYDHPAVAQKRHRRQLNRILAKYYSYEPAAKAQKKIKIAIIARDATSRPKSSVFIRLIAPLSSPKLKDVVHYELFDEDTTYFGGSFDVCIVQRTAFSDVVRAQKLIKYLKDTGTLLVADIDDSFNLIEPDHPEHDVLKTMAEALNETVKHADETWFSTKQLIETYPLANNPVVIPNSLDPRLWRKSKPTKTSKKKRQLRFLYMGTSTHDADLAMIMPALDAVASQHPKSFSLTLVGVATDIPERPWIRKLYPRTSQAIYPKFVGWFLRHSNYDIGIAPLTSSRFNEGKSDIKCLDYLAAGIVPLVSDVTPYKSHELDSHILRAQNSTEGWITKLNEIVVDPGSVREANAERIASGQKYIWSQRSNTAVATILLERLTAKTKSR